MNAARIPNTTMRVAIEGRRRIRIEGARVWADIVKVKNGFWGRDITPKVDIPDDFNKCVYLVRKRVKI
jgi:hypothetical protein